ncbi:hypothetical protein AB0K51_29615 [Kitasatospora sp. NPDC049285]|uniref:hypothetical protein n=1 Tax=Kitasatospora sp. NPDC049285 TaxID=3157096 RepID=UPI0034155D18
MASRWQASALAACAVLVAVVCTAEPVGRADGVGGGHPRVYRPEQWADLNAKLREHVGVGPNPLVDGTQRLVYRDRYAASFTFTTVDGSWCFGTIRIEDGWMSVCYPPGGPEPDAEPSASRSYFDAAHTHGAGGPWMQAVITTHEELLGFDCGGHPALLVPFGPDPSSSDPRRAYAVLTDRRLTGRAVLRVHRAAGDAVELMPLPDPGEVGPDQLWVC